MVHNCVLCHMSSRTADASVTFHTFPKDNDRRGKWLQAINLNEVSKCARLCSNHFKSTDFNETIYGQRRSIKDTAIPIIRINAQNLENTSEEQSDNKEEYSKEYNDAAKDNLISLKRKSMEDDESDDALQHIKNIKSIKGIDVNKILKNPEEAKVTFEVAVDTIVDQERKIRNLQSHLNKLKKQVQSLTALNKHLYSKNFLSEKALEHLDSASPVVKTIVQKVLSQSDTFAKCPPELQSFAASLHFYSPKAYEYVRENFMKMLPHQSTIRSWYTNVNGYPGICKPALEFLKEKANNARQKNEILLCSLLIDDIAIRKKIEWHKNEYVGYINFGTKIDNTDLPEASSAVVLMIVEVNGHCKIPIAYHFIESLNSTERANLINDTLTYVHETGVLITSVTFDGPGYNFVMATKLGAQLNIDKDLQVYFLHPVLKTKIFVVLDACHMLKLIRNAFGKLQVFVDGEGNIIKWSFLEKLVEIQEQHGLHAATKIRKRHLRWQNEKMKVFLAAQTLSNSVAKALAYLREDLQLPEFKNSEGTEKFCYIINEAFDILNSRNKFNTDPQKMPISESNIHDIQEKIAKIETYIRSLTVNGQSIVHCGRKTGFIGIIISLHSAVGIFNTWIAPNLSVHYLLTYKLSQDHLELFFSAVRSRCGHNNNPTCLQFIAAFKKLLIHAQIGGSKSANCLAQDNTAFLHIFPLKAKNGIDEITNENDSNDFNAENSNVDHDHDYYLYTAFDNLNKSYIDDIVAYIAGFIVFKILKKISCDICKRQLCSNMCYSKLQNIKNRGTLMNASNDVVTLCKIAEITFRENESILTKKNILHTLLIKTLRKVPNDIFNNNITHLFDQNPLNDHRLQLIKLVLNKYFKARCTHYGNSKCSNMERVRSKLTKLIHFKSQ